MFLVVPAGRAFVHIGFVAALSALLALQLVKHLDVTTGTLAVQFKFPNPQRVVRPGQYGRARFVLETKAGALLVPQRAVSA